MSYGNFCERVGSDLVFVKLNIYLKKQFGSVIIRNKSVKLLHEISNCPNSLSNY